ncbi:hypothetical protein ACS0TY_028297 [Phlomoides rotata]
MLDPYTCSCFSSVMYIDGRSNYSIFEPNLHIDFVNALHLHVTPLKRPKMDASTRAMVEAIHANPTQAVLYLSGGASQAFGWLLSLPGASNTVLEAIVPYSRMSVIQLLGKVSQHLAWVSLVLWQAHAPSLEIIACIDHRGTLLELAPWKKRKELIAGVLPITFVEGQKKKRRR